MFDWLSPWVFLQTMARVAVVWLAFYGAGKVLRKPLRIDSVFPLLPSEILGLLAFVVLTIPLSLLGILNRTVCPVILVILAIPGVLFAYGNLRDRFPLPKPKPVTVFLGLFLLFALLLNFTYASMPNLAFDDPLVTYAVQPDRWLNRGCIYWLGETAFSGFPLLYEMTALWPAAISSDRINQLSVLQVFQMSMLVLAVIRGMSLVRLGKGLKLPTMVTVLITTSVYTWCSMAKNDTMALLFGTMALAAAVRQREKDFSGFPLSSWLFMGLTLATKQTAVIMLAPFLLYSAGSFLGYSVKWKAMALAALVAFPGAFAARTMLKTGSPTYPFYPITSMVREGWELNRPAENTIVNTRSSYLYEHKNFPLAKHIGIFFAYMEGNVLLLIAGIATALIMRRWGDLYLVLPILVYSAIAIAAFWPPWWGAKYSIPFYPFVALIGARLLSGSKAGASIAVILLLPAFIIPGFIAVAGEPRGYSYRTAVTSSVLMGRWNTESGYRMWMSTPEGMTHMWANTALPSETVIVSLHEEKRYFFDGTVIVGWRHPVAQRLYLENTLDEELAILDELGADYVAINRENPVVLDQERKLEILDHIGTGDLLEPVVIIDGGYLLCRYNPRPELLEVLP